MAVYDVFLSYRRSDGSDLAKDLYQKLQRAGLRVFFDQSEMVDGHYFNTQISAALKQAPNYLLVATPEVFPFRDEAQESDWVKKEIELAFEQYEQDPQNRSLNILMLPETEFPAKMPESLKNLDFPNRIEISWSLQSSELQRILRAVCHVNRRNIWHAAHRWLEESKQPGHRFASLHVNESIMPQAKHHKEDRQDQTTFPIHVSKEANDMQNQEIPLLDALRETSGHLYLIGQGGIGKTTALMHIMEAAYHEKQYTETAQIPIFIELSRAPDTEGRLYDGITSTYIRRSVYQQIREDLYVKQVSHSAVREVEEVFDVEPSVAVKPVEELFLAKQDGQSPEYLLLLDGLNEVSYTEVNELPVISRIIREIQWLMDCPNVRVILTSRTDEEAVFHENISRLYLTGIQNEAIRDYLQKSKHKEEMDAIFQNEPLLETLRIPLFLMMYAGLGQTKDVSSQGEILRIFFHEREQNLEDYTIQTRAKQVEQDVATASPKQSSVRITAQMQSFLLDFLLPEIAWAMERSDTFYIDTETIEEIIAPILTDKSDTAICGKYGKGLFTKYRTSSAKEHTAATAKKFLALGDITESLIDIATRSLGILQERNGTYGFIHHHIRDYFAAARHVVHLRLAVYLQEKGSEQALTCLDDLKAEPIHLNIRRFIGEMLGEHHNAPQCINGTWTEMVPKETCDRTLLQRALFLYRNRFDEKNDYSVFTLVSILKEVRKDLSGIDFSGLNLTNCSLNGVRLGQIGIVANINDAKVNDSTFFHMGHTDRITTIACSPDGHHLATGSVDHTVKIWGIDTKNCIQTLNGHKNTVWIVCYSPNSDYIISGSADKTIKIWDSKTKVCTKTLYGHSGAVTNLACSSDFRYILSACNDRTAKIWDVKTGKCLHTLVGITSDIVSVSYSPNNNYIALALNDGKIKLWDSTTYRYLQTLNFAENLSTSCHKNGLIKYSISFCHDESHWYASIIEDSAGVCFSLNRFVHIFDIFQNKHVQTLGDYPFSHNREIVSSSAIFNNKYISTISLDGTAKIWNVLTGVCVYTLNNVFKGTPSTMYMPHCFCKEYIITVSSSGFINFWNITTNTCVQIFAEYSDYTTSAAFSPADENYVVIGSNDGTVKKWNIKNGICEQVLADHNGCVFSAAYSPCGKYILTTSIDSSAKVWDATTGMYVQSLKCHFEPTFACIDSAYYSPDGQYVVSASEDDVPTLLDIEKDITFWGAIATFCIQILKDHYGPHFFQKMKSLYYSYDFRYLASTKSMSSIAVSSSKTGERIQSLIVSNRYISCFCCSPDGLHLAIALDPTDSYLPSIQIWNIKTGECVDELDLPSSLIFNRCESIKYSPDGKLIAAVSYIGDIIIWENQGRGVCVTLSSSSYEDSVYSIAFTSNSSCIISGCANGKIKIWDLSKILWPTNVFDLSSIASKDPIRFITCSADDAYIGTISENGLFNLWNMSTKNHIATFPNIPGLIVQGVDFRHIHPDSSLDEEHRELLRRYGAIID